MYICVCVCIYRESVYIYVELKKLVSLVALAIKNLPAMQVLGFNPWAGTIPWRRKWQPLQYSCLDNPMDGEAWQATVHGVAKSWTRLSD